MSDTQVSAGTMLSEIPTLAKEVLEGWPVGVQSPRYDGVGGGHSGLSASPSLVDLDRYTLMFGEDNDSGVTIQTLYAWAGHVFNESEEAFGNTPESIADYGLSAICSYLHRSLAWSHNRGWDEQMISDIAVVWKRLRKYAGIISRPGSKHSLAMLTKWKESPEYLTPDELESRLSVNAATVRSWASRHKLQARYNTWEVIRLAYGDLLKEIEESTDIDLTNEQKCDSVANE